MKKQKRGLIVTGGTVDTEFVSSYLAEHEFDYIMAVDKGLVACHAMKLNVDYILGDFDSVDPEILALYKGQEGTYEIRTLNPEKDMTDTEEAIDVAMEAGITDLTIVGATGTRLDHVLANINLLMKPLKNSVKACILDKNNRIYVRNNNFTITKAEVLGKYVSFIPLTTEVTGITLTGFKYPLQNYTLSIGNSRAVSNELEADVASVELTDGILIVIESRD